MSPKKRYLLISLAAILAGAAWWLVPSVLEKGGALSPATVYTRTAETGGTEKPCPDEHPEWRKAQTIDGVSIDEALSCDPDNPYDIAAAVKGTNNISMATLMQTRMAQDAVVKKDDLDGDGDPDVIEIKLEVVELNGASPDGEFLINTFDIAPGIKPGLWVFAPKSQGMALKNFFTMQANPILRAPSPTIRVEQGDTVKLTLENIHYLPHTIHLHGVDHPFMTAAGEDNDGMEEHAVFPGSSHTYEMKPRHTGTMLYHCHVQTAQHMMMGLSGIFVVEENKPNNWVQTFNIGAGQVRHPSVKVKEDYSREFDLLYQSLDKKLSAVIQNANDTRLIVKRMSREYNITESHENYFLLNGHSFPYTVRDGLIAAGENENIKLRIANAQRSPMALHIHGHKVTVTATDGVERPEAVRETRDVLDIAPAQRLDVDLKTVNDGLHSYGPGVWMFHDHASNGETTDGMEPGGNISLIGYQAYLDAQGMPKMHGEMLDVAFDKNYYAKNQPPWAVGDFTEMLGEPGRIEPNVLKLVAFGLACGAALGLLVYLIFTGYRSRQ
ncbi:multicopper oxidase domain-containing protein [Methylomicrobium sp. Wu6]|uniref:multicopper oxidase domain-containing protein n=1 Tax=Methylomicrobium sp. Wu6 TaxID=3107928 RepID=UPI002DD67B2D|nr:multicopper oxidase domain-containing protein [Methylomicrobium sp. Wu6]MEC4748035.1 multicopper oxidase domain-containing protein [Methylomicrobium sp. Wu6]